MSPKTPTSATASYLVPRLHAFARSPTGEKFLFRATAALPFAAFSVFLHAMSRTSGFGASPQEHCGFILQSLMLVAIPLSVPFWGMRLWKVMIGTFLLWWNAFFSVEGYAKSQELYLISRYGENPSTTLSFSRWWPFESHSIHGDPSGWTGCD